MTDNVLEVKRLRTYFDTKNGMVKAVDDVSFGVKANKTIALVGESGCGKSVTAMSLMRLVSPPGMIVGGEVLLRGDNILSLAEKDVRKIRGSKISMIFQEPMTSLNPVFTIGNQISESITTHQRVSKKQAREMSIEMLKLVGIASPEDRIYEYPHQMSGGMRQRVMIAMALSCKPDVLIADEPTTALDVTVQSQILELISGLQSESGMSVILITHSLGIVAEVAEDMVVMYAGKVVECGKVSDVFSHPRHPYTLGLLRALPPVGGLKKRLYAIPGTVPELINLPAGCAFHQRCSFAMDECAKKMPELVALDNEQHFSRCLRAREI